MKKFISVLALALCSMTINAETLWSDYSVTYLNGSDYEVGDSKRQVATFEHTAKTTWGTSFMFFDRLESDNGDLATYGEWSPRIKITDFEGSFIQSVYAAGTVEIGGNFTHYLAGVGTNLDMPGFNFFQANLYSRNNDGYDTNYQATLVWGLPVGPLYYDGFMDYTTSNDQKEASMNLTSQLKYNVAPHLGLTSKLFVGVEYVYWMNKFGIDGVDEKNVNLLVKYHF